MSALLTVDFECQNYLLQCFRNGFLATLMIALSLPLT